MEEQTTVVISKETSDQSKEFIGQWNQLISTTNWDKGQIICQWRDSLEKEGVPAAERTDEAWSQMVGGVTPQHVGRLRRTFERFGEVFKEYSGIYWSHFYAALEWDDAEMWLEGAVQSKWSVSGMRKQRWEAMGKVGEQPNESDIVTAEITEETQSLNLTENDRNNDRDYVEGPVHEGPDWGDDQPSTDRKSSDSDDGESGKDKKMSSADVEEVRSFDSFTDLPDDIIEAVNKFKMAIMHHKTSNWEEVEKQEVLDLLDAIKNLAAN